MASGKQLDALFTTAPRARLRGRCVVCGKERTSRITAIVARLDNHAKPVQGQNTSTSVQLCDEHALELWEAVRAALT